MKRFEEALRAAITQFSSSRIMQKHTPTAASYCVELRRFEEALQSYDRAIQLKPNFEFLSGIILHTKMNICDWSNYSDSVAELRDRIDSRREGRSAFSVLAFPELTRRCKERLRKVG